MSFRAVEFRQAARSLIRTPAIALSAVLCLAIGIGTTTATATAIMRALLDPLPFAAPGELVAVHRVTPQSGPAGTWPMSPGAYLDLAATSRTIRDLAAMTTGTGLVTLRTESVQATQLYVTPHLFAMLGARPALGRLLVPSDSSPDQSPVAVVSYEFWRTLLGGDSAAVGSKVLIDGQLTTVVGVAQPTLRVPHGGRVMRAELWMPLTFPPAARTIWRNNSMFVLGRMRAGATPATVDAEMRAQFRRIAEAHPEVQGEGVRAASLHAENLRTIRTPLLLVFGASALVLLVACTNVASLLLARGVQRRREIAIRTAIGASPWDVGRLALTEGLLISLAGTGVGVLLALAGVRTIGALAAARLPQLDGMQVDGRVLALALVLSLLVAFACAVVPAWRSASVDPQEALGSGRGGGSGRRHHRALRMLVATEVATSLVLLIGAALLMRSFSQLVSSSPGFETDRVLTLRITASPQQYVDRPAVRAFMEPALDAIRAVPGVASAAAISLIPYAGWGNNDNVRYEGVPKDNPTQLPLAEVRQISPSFFETTGQRLVDGRLLTPSDDENAPVVVVVNEALVARDFAGRSPIGKRFHLDDSTFATIVGVVEDIRNNGPFEPAAPEMYSAYRQAGPATTSFGVMVRVRGDDPSAVTAQVRAAVRSVDATAAIARVAAMRDVIATSLGQPRFYLGLMGAFAVAALLLAAAGLYGLLSYAVAQRTREFGIRLALGSRPAQLVKLVTVQGAKVVLGGLVVGLIGATAMTGLLESMLFGLSPLDIRAWLVGTVLMLAVGLLAAAVPAIRATRVDPSRAMQAE